MDIFNVSCLSVAPTTSAPAPATSAFPNTSSVPSTAPPVPSPPIPTMPASPVPSYIVAAAAATSGHFPRALELVQFLSIYCTSLSSQQQNRLSQFQIASFTNIALSQDVYCKICPGSCSKPSALVLPTFALISSLFAVSAAVVLFDLYTARTSAASKSSGVIRDRLLAAETPSAGGRYSLLKKISVFCTKYFRSFVETSSSYVLMPSTFVFVMNVLPSSFVQCDLSDRAMIVTLPIITLLLRAIVIRQRVVALSSSDQKQLYAGSICNFANAVILGVFFNQARTDRLSDDDQLTPPFASSTSPQYLVLAMLATQLTLETVIRRRAIEASILDRTDWPWSSATSKASPAAFAFDGVAARPAKGSVKTASAATVIAVSRFLLLNYLVLSQIAMVITGLASSGATSWVGVEASSVLIGAIPLIASGAMFLYNAVRCIRMLWLRCRPKQAGACRSDNDVSREL